jgi:putative hydrolase of the HAD superfamily
MIQKLHIDTLIEAAQLPPGNLGVLETLAARMPVALVSNFDDGKACRRLLRDRGLLPYLDAVLISEEVGLRKPHPFIFREAARLVDCPCEEMLFVGDNPIDDIDGCRAVGMRPVWLPGPVPPPDGWQEPEDRITDLEELLTTVDFGGTGSDADDS